MKKGGQYLLLVSLLLAITIYIAYYNFHYKPNQKQLTILNNKIRELKQDIAVEEESIDKAKKDIANMDLGLVNLNYFNRNGIKGEEKTAFFLKMINSQANKLGISFISITPNMSEKKKGYIKESFEIRITTDFYRLMALLYQIQNSLGLNLDRLIIRAEDDAQPSKTTTIIELHSLEMIKNSDQNVLTLEELRELHLKEETNLRDIKLNSNKKKKVDDVYASLTKLQTNLRDPFIKPENIEKIQERLKQIEKELNESRLLGIIEFEGHRHAIIGRHTVKEGDNIFNMIVQEISDDTVILGDSGLKFTYQIKKNENNP